MSASPEALTMVELAASTAARFGGEDLVALDVSALLPFADAFLIVSGTSERNVSAISREVEDSLVSAGFKALRREGREGGRWALLDFGDLVVHVFHPEERVYYSLERLWRDCPVIPVAVASHADADEDGERAERA